MLSHRTSFDWYRDLVQHTGQVFFLLRDEETNYSKAAHHHSWEEPQAGHSPSSHFILVVLGDLSRVCVSEVVRPRAVAEPGHPGACAPAPSEVWGAGCRVTCFSPNSNLQVESDMGTGFSIPPQCCPGHTAVHSHFVEATTGSLTQSG